MTRKASSSWVRSANLSSKLRMVLEDPSATSGRCSCIKTGAPCSLRPLFPSLKLEKLPRVLETYSGFLETRCPTPRNL